MPEHDCLPPDLVAAEFVTHMARMSGLPRTAARERASEALRHVGLYEERYRQIGGYSTGMKQRVKLAQALVHDPDLLLLDEPTNGLDPAGRDAMLALIHRIGTEFGISVVVCSHLLGEVERICDSLIAIDAGRLLRADRVDGDDHSDATCSWSRSPRAPRSWLAQLRGARARRAPRTARRCWCRWPTTTPTTVILGAVAELDLPLHRLDQRRHRVAELFADRRGGRSCRLRRRPASSTTSATSATPAPGSAAATPSGSLYAHGLRTAFGLGRSAKAKIFPWIVVGVVDAGRAWCSPRSGAQTGEAVIAVPGVPEAMSAAASILFCAVVAPELVSRDLRSGVLPLYFSRPLHPRRLRAGQAGRAGHGGVAAAGRAAAADVPRRGVLG